jgi:hypothetical protein
MDLSCLLTLAKLYSHPQQLGTCAPTSGMHPICAGKALVTELPLCLPQKGPGHRAAPLLATERPLSPSCPLACRRALASLPKLMQLGMKFRDVEEDAPPAAAAPPRTTAGRGRDHVLFTSLKQFQLEHLDRVHGEDAPDRLKALMR